MVRKGNANGLGSSPVIRERPVRSAAAAYSSENGGSTGLKLTLPAMADRSNTEGFVEPELAIPEPGIAGYTLESLPPAKQKRVIRKSKLLTARLSPELDANTLEERESEYKDNLQTPELERLTGLLELRSVPEAASRSAPTLSLLKRTLQSNLSAVPQEKREKLFILLPATPRLLPAAQDLTPGSRVSKKIKIISPKRLPLLLVQPSEVPSSDSESPNNNDDFCSTCGGTGIFICCDLCPRSFHLLCCSPPLLEVPDDEDWNCRECRAKRGVDLKPSWNDIGIFGLLLNDLHGSNPSEFCLPKHLRESTFMNVYSGDDNQYMDSLLKEEGARNGYGGSHGGYSGNGGNNGGNGGQLTGFNRNEDLDVESLYDKNGKPYMCHKCGLSGLQRRTLIFCDFCPLVWHLDCLETPMCVPKTLGLKWRCPNHVESLLPSYWLERRSFKDSVVVDLGLQNNFLRYLLASNFLVKFSDQPYIGDNYAPLLPEYLNFQRDDFFSDKTSYIEAVIEANSGDGASNGNINNYSSTNNTNSNDSASGSLGSAGSSKTIYTMESEKPDTDANYRLPPFLQSYGINEGVVARSSHKLSRMLVMTDDSSLKPFVYRVPEQQILLDFVKKSKTSRGEILKLIRAYEEKATKELDEDQAVINALLSIRGEAPTAVVDEIRNDEVTDVKMEEDLNTTTIGDEKTSFKQEKLDLELKRLVASVGKDELLKLVSAM